MCKIGKIIGCCLIAVSLLAFTACSGLDRLSENLKDGAEQLSNVLITPYQSFEGSRTSDNDFFRATYDASVTGFNGQDILVADTDLKENECREIVIRYQLDSLDGCQRKCCRSASSRSELHRNYRYRLFRHNPDYRGVSGRMI